MNLYHNDFIETFVYNENCNLKIIIVKTLIETIMSENQMHIWKVKILGSVYKLIIVERDIK